MKKVKFFDSTLRDGSHALQQKLNSKQIESYCKAIDCANMYTVIVGHGNGIGASSIQMGVCELEEMEMLRIAKENLSNTRLGAFVTIGFGTIENHIVPAISTGADIFCIASHCTEADTQKKHIQYLANLEKEVYGVLMNIHLADVSTIVEQAKLIEMYGADGVILMDSAGASTPEQVEGIISALCSELKIEVGFHPHNNLGLAVANAYTAIRNGASIIDGTVGGFGAGAGNCQLEALLALLLKENVTTSTKLYPVLDASNEVVKKLMRYEKMIDSTCIISGYAGVVSTFKNRVERMAEQYNVDPRDIFVELGNRKAIAGQDDLILEVVKTLSEKKGEW